jgi:hypothetical protein
MADAKKYRKYIKHLIDTKKYSDDSLLKIKDDTALIERFERIFPPSIVRMLADEEEAKDMAPLMLFNNNSTLKATAEYLSQN